MLNNYEHQRASYDESDIHETDVSKESIIQINL